MPTTSRSRSRGALAFLAVSAATALAFIGAIETYLQLTIPPSHSSYEPLYEYTLETPRYKLLRKNVRLNLWGVEFQTNDLGFRDDEPTVPPKAPGEYRVIVLGDSFSMGRGVPFDSLYTALTERHLRETLDAVRVLNLAVGGYNVIQYRHLLEEVGLGLDPDLVVVALFPYNDFDNETYEENSRAAHRLSDDASPRWYEGLYVYRAYVSKLEWAVRRWWSDDEEARSQRARDSYQQNLAALDAIVELCRNRDVPLTVIVLPTSAPLDAERRLFARVLDHCGRRNVDCVSLLEWIGARPASEVRLNVIDAHPNERYHALVAERLVPVVERLLAEVTNGDRLRAGTVP